MEGLVPCTPNAVISISYIRSISLCNEYVTNLFFLFPTALSPWPQVWILCAKLLQKSEMRKDIVIELSYRGFSRASDYSWSHRNHRWSQIRTPLRYLFVTMPERAANGHGQRNKTLRISELLTTHATNPVTEKDCAVPPCFAYRQQALHKLILNPKN